MSLFKKTLSNLGIGDAKVDAEVTGNVLLPGQNNTMIIHLYGGAHVQRIERVEVNLQCRYWSETAIPPVDDEALEPIAPKRYESWSPLFEWQHNTPFEIGSGQRHDLSIDVMVPWNTPVTIDDAKLWLEITIVDTNGKKTIEYQSLTVRPESLMDTVLTSLESNGFRLRQVKCEALDGFISPYAQTFEWVPVDGPFHGCLRELTVLMYRDQDHLKLWFDVDRRQRGELDMLASAVVKGRYLHYLCLHEGLVDSDVVTQLNAVLEQCESEIAH